MNRPDSRGTLQGIPATLPVSLAVGADDALTPLAATREMHKLVPHATLEIVQGCGHMLPLEAEGEDFLQPAAGPLRQ